MLQGKKVGQNLTVNPSLLVSSSNLMLENSPPLSAKNPWEGNPTLMHQESIITCIMVSALLLLINLPTINLEKLSIIHRTYLLPKSFKSRVTTSLKEEALGRVTQGSGYRLLNFFANLTIINYSLYYIHHFWAHPSCIPICLQ